MLCEMFAPLVDVARVPVNAYLGQRQRAQDDGGEGGGAADEPGLRGRRDEHPRPETTMEALRRLLEDDFAAIQVGWHPKSQMMEMIADELGIGLGPDARVEQVAELPVADHVVAEREMAARLTGRHTV